MSRINDLDKVLLYIRNFSKDLANIETVDLPLNTGIEIDISTEYLEELKNRGLITLSSYGTYITLQGRMAIENSKFGKPFQAELNNKRLKKTWTIIKIIAGVLNAVAIISIGIWTQYSSNKSDKFIDKIELLEKEIKTERIKYEFQIDSLKNVIIVNKSKLNISNKNIKKNKK